MSYLQLLTMQLWLEFDQYPKHGLFIQDIKIHMGSDLGLDRQNIGVYIENLI